MLKRFALALSLFASTAHAREHHLIARDKDGNWVAEDDRVGFGVPGQWAITTDAELAVRRTTLTGQKGAVTSLTFAPGVDYFIIPNLSLGGGVAVVYTRAGSQNATTFQIGPRVGWNFEVSKLFSVWPKLGFVYSHSNQDAARERANGVAINLFAPVLVHPAPHFLVGFGPFLNADVSGATRATTWGFKLTMGGWLNSNPKQAAPAAQP